MNLLEILQINNGPFYYPIVMSINNAIYQNITYKCLTFFQLKKTIKIYLLVYISYIRLLYLLGSITQHYFTTHLPFRLF